MVTLRCSGTSATPVWQVRTECTTSHQQHLKTPNLTTPQTKCTRHDIKLALSVLGFGDCDLKQGSRVTCRRTNLEPNFPSSFSSLNSSEPCPSLGATQGGCPRRITPANSWFLTAFFCRSKISPYLRSSAFPAQAESRPGDDLKAPRGSSCLSLSWSPCLGY